MEDYTKLSPYTCRWCFKVCKGTRGLAQHFIRFDSCRYECADPTLHRQQVAAASKTTDKKRKRTTESLKTPKKEDGNKRSVAMSSSDQTPAPSAQRDVPSSQAGAQQRESPPIGSCVENKQEPKAKEIKDTKKLKKDGNKSVATMTSESIDCDKRIT
jgi:hypothetical protein